MKSELRPWPSPLLTLPGSAALGLLLVAGSLAGLAQTTPSASPNDAPPKDTSPTVRILKLQPAVAKARPPVVAAAHDYSNEPLVEELSHSTFRYNADGTGDRTVRAVLHLQSDAALRQFGLLTFHYAADNESVELRYVRVRKANGAVIATDAGAAQDLPVAVTREAPLFRDQHQLRLPIRSLSVGDRIEYEAVIHMRKAEAPGEFWGAFFFEKHIVALDERIELRFPATRRLTVLSPDHKPEISTEAGDTIYRWHSRQLKASVPPPGRTASSSDDALSQQTVPDVAWTTFADWAAVGDWYRSLSAGRAAPPGAIRAKAAALTAGAAWPLEAPDNGDHLGAVLEKEGKPADALRPYTLTGSFIGVQADTSPTGPPAMLAMSARRNALLTQGAKVGLPQGESVARAEIRSLHLPQDTREPTEAEFFMLASAGIVEKVVFLEGDPHLQDKAATLQQALAHTRSALPFPVDAHAHPARRAVLSRSPLTRDCELTFYLPATPASPQPPHPPAFAAATTQAPTQKD